MTSCGGGSISRNNISDNILDLESESVFINFESAHVRPLAKSLDGKKLFAVNTPSSSLEVFDITDSGLTYVASVPVGMEPVAVGVKSNAEIWVVNHLSDSISVVDLSFSHPRVVKTLLVGDEPRDIVFAGTPIRKAFITTAHRGQNTPFSSRLMPTDPSQAITPDIGRADVWVFNTERTGDGLGGKPETIITLFTDTPRALAVSADSTIVYAAGFLTGNQTTIVKEGTVCNGKIESGFRKQNSDNIVVTERQYEILNLLAKGLLNKQIANELNISVNTVSAHLHEIFSRLHVNNRTAAVQSAQKIGLI